MLLVLMSLEKCFAVYFPLKSKAVCTVTTAKWVTGAVGIIFAGYNSMFFFIIKAGIIESSGYDTCVYTVDMTGALDIVDSILYSFGPFTFIFITNFAIVFKFIRSKFNSRSSSTESTNQALFKAATRGTVMVVTVSVTFLILTAPTAVSYACSFTIRLDNVPSYRVFQNITQYLNHSINGLLYIIVGSRFRNELLKILCRKERPDTISFTQSRNNTSLTSISGSST